MTERETREALVEHGRSLFMRGYSCGTSGNLSVRLPEDGGYLMSPTNVSLGRLTADAISKLDAAGHHVGGAPPTKEAWLHMAMYAARPDDQAVVHLHSTYAAALSCRSDRPADDVLPALTPYVIMRVGRVARVPYSRPGDTGAGRSDRAAGGAPSRRAARQSRAGRGGPGPRHRGRGGRGARGDIAAVLRARGTAASGLTPGQIDELQRVFGA